MAGARSSTRRDLVARLFGRRNRRRGTDRERWTLSRQALVRPLALAGVGVVVLVAWPVVRDTLARHPYFAVREVVVRGHRRLAPDALRSAAGISPGMSIWDVDCRRAEEQMRREPWVRSARVQRQLPHRVVIQVREERPAAILVATPRTGAAPTAPALYYVVAGGRIVAPVGAAEARDFPYLTGVGPDDLGEGDAFGAHAIRQALRLMRAASRTGAVSEVHVDRARGLTLLPVSPPLPIEIGWGHYADKLGRLPAVLQQWTGREAEIASVSLLFNDEVIVRTKATKPAPPTRPATRT